MFETRWWGISDVRDVHDTFPGSIVKEGRLGVGRNESRVFRQIGLIINARFAKPFSVVEQMPGLFVEIHEHVGAVAGYNYSIKRNLPQTTRAAAQSIPSPMHFPERLPSWLTVAKAFITSSVSFFKRGNKPSL